MKKTIQFFLTISIFCFSYQFSFCQNSKEKATHRAWVKKTDKSRTIEGDLYRVGDSLEIILPKYKNNVIKHICIRYIKYVEVRKKGKLGKSILAGALSGMALGAIIGYASYEEPKCSPNSFCLDLDFGPGFSALGGGVLGIIPGAIIGGVIGGVKVRIPIKGSKKSMKQQQEELRKYTIN